MSGFFKSNRTRAALGLALAIGLSSAAQAAAYIPLFPLKPSANNRYLVDQNNVPFMIVGDSPQALIGNLSAQQATVFIKNRAKYGVNALWINLLCASYTACNSGGTTYDGIKPFTTPEDLSTPNPAYFDRAAAMLSIAASKNMVVLLDPIETGSWLSVLNSNGVAKAYAFGQFLGNRFKNVPNIIWMSGNDFQSWQDPNQNALVIAVAKGILSTDSNHIHTAELSYLVSATMDSKPWRSIIGLNAVYTYEPTYAKEISEYRRTVFTPTFMVEANYEFEQNGGTDGGSLPNLRHQEYWSMLSGTTGQLYGSQFSWRLDGDWVHNLDTIGILQFSYMKKLFETRAWYDLVPDRDHLVLTKGFGKFSQDDPIDTDTYATAARTTDGKLVMVYAPSVRNMTIDMTQLSGRVQARWFDPTNATLSQIAGSPFLNVGTHVFTPPAANSAGDGDFVLVLEAK